MGKVVALFGSSRAAPGSEAYARALAFGRAIAEEGFALVTGGYGGVMEAASRGAKEAGGLVIGVTAPPVFPGRGGANPFLDLELPSPSLPARIGRMLDLAAAAVALPGGVGTLAEIALAWNLAYVDRLAGRRPRPLAVHAEWRTVLRPGLEVRPEDLALLWFFEDEAELRAFLREIG